MAELPRRGLSLFPLISRASEICAAKEGGCPKNSRRRRIRVVRLLREDCSAMNASVTSLPADLTPQALDAWLSTGNAVQIVDLRPGVEYRGARIHGARHLPFHRLARESGELDTSVPVVLVCQAGVRSAEARDRLFQAGRQDVTHVTGGMNAWIATGLPVERDPHAPWAIDRQVRVGAGGLVLAGVLLGVAVHPAFHALSAFIGAGLIFAGATNWCGMSLLLARAPWNR